MSDGREMKDHGIYYSHPYVQMTTIANLQTDFFQHSYNASPTTRIELISVMGPRDTC